MTGPEKDLSFRAFEHEAWERVVSVYHTGFGELTSQTIEPLLDAADVREGAQVLDVACGPGYVAAATAARGAHVIGVDFSIAMVTEARGQYPDVEYRVGDAEELSFPDARFDSVVMNFGLLHLERPERALSEAHRVLRPKGRMAFTVWDEPSVAVGFKIVLDAIEKWGDMNVPLPPGPPFFRYRDREEATKALLEAGFDNPERVELRLVWRVPSPEAPFEFMLGGTARTGGLLRAQKSDALEAIRRAVGEATAPYQVGDTWEVPMQAVVYSAAKA